MDEARYRELKEKMAALKSLYASRHYSQCAKFGELLLSEIHDQTHPLHLAHLNFYTALSHDTLAREATLKNRWRELSLADKHYTAAIDVLSPLHSPTPDDPWSPASAAPSPYSRRRSSVYSATSAASSATSLNEDDYLHTTPKHSCHPQPSSTLPLSSKSPSTEALTQLPSTPRPHTPQQFYFAANIVSFTRMLEAHRSDIRAQKEKTGVPTVRFAMPSPRPSPVKTRWSRELGDGEERDGEEAMEKVREMRRNVMFRPRFDPESVRRLCGEAMAELEG